MYFEEVFSEPLAKTSYWTTQKNLDLVCNINTSDSVSV